MKTKSFTQFLKGLLAIAIILLSLNVEAQISASDANSFPFTPENLITDHLLGDGIQIVNITYSGSNRSIGTFSGGASTIGIDEGILLTTGFVKSQGADIGIMEAGDNGGAAEPNQSSSDNGSGATSPNLDIIASSSLHNITKYEIEFIPSSDSIRFKYVFASEEYPEFPCEAYNDIFGFFISGPGFSGPYTDNAENIALVPGTNLPVTIDNVHPLNSDNACAPLNEQYYNDNTTSANNPVFDGFLDVFIAEAEVQPCQTYKLIIVIADQGDEQRDSGVFLEAKSFGSNSLDIETEIVSLDGYMVEGCSEANLVIKLNQTTTVPLSINVDILNDQADDATNGVDFTNIATPIVIPAGSSEITIPIEPLEDNVTEGVEWIRFDVQINSCTRDTFQIPIRERTLDEIEIRDTTICEGNTVDFDVELNVPTTSYLYDNNTQGAILSGSVSEPTQVERKIDVSGVPAIGVKDGIIESVCLDISNSTTEDLEIYLIAPNGKLITLSSLNGTGTGYTSTCFKPTASVSISDGDNPFTGDFVPQSEWKNLYGSSINGEWSIVVLNTGTSNGVLTNWSITFSPLYSLDYSWTPTDGSLSCDDCPKPTASPNATTTYQATVQDNYGCDATDQAVITLTPDLSAPNVNCSSTINSVSISWPAVTDATSYEVSVDGATAVSPNDGTLGHKITGLSAGDEVEFVVTSIGDCPGASTTLTCTALDCPTLTINPTPSDALCNGGDGSAVVTTSGGKSPYSYDINGTTNTDGNFSNLSVGTHTVVVTDDDGCTGQIEFTINEPTALTISPLLITNVDCNGTLGSGTVEVAEGTAPYSFAWPSGQTDSIGTNLAAADYIVTVTDANSCTIEQTVTIGSDGGFTINLAQKDACFEDNNGLAYVTNTGGVAPFNYLWDDTNTQTTDTLKNVEDGTYNVTVTDNDGCIQLGTINVGENPEIVVSATSTDTNCGGTPDGTTTAVASGGTGTLAYLWDDNNSQTTAVATGLNGGLYTVIVTDDVGCTNSASSTVSTPSSLNLDATNTTQISCFGETDGKIEVVVSGGTGVITYLWDGGETVATISGLAAGSYHCEIKDEASCTMDVNVTIVEPIQITISETVEDIKCGGNTGEIDITVHDAIGTITYLWDDGDNNEDRINLAASQYTVSVTDANGCKAEKSIEVKANVEIVTTLTPKDSDCSQLPAYTGEISTTTTGGVMPYTYLWSDVNGQTTSKAHALPGGKYIVTITDDLGCMIIDSAVVGAPDPFILDSLVVLNNICTGDANGIANIYISGGNGAFSYAWDGGETTSQITNLLEGKYIVTVTDEASCEYTDSVTLVDPAPIGLTATSQDVQCANDNNGTLEVFVNGGTGTPSFLWENGEITAVINNLAADDYTVTVTDANGCTEEGTFTVNSNSSMSLALESTEIMCHGDQDAQIASSVSGGNPGYTYLWATGETSDNITNIGAGTYYLSVYDANNCLTIDSATISEPSPLDLDLEKDSILCYGEKSGFVELSGSGGVGPYEYRKGSGNYQTTGIFELMAAGMYSFEMKDKNNCIVDTSGVEISQPAPMELTLESEIRVEIGDTVTFEPKFGGGVGGYDFDWMGDYTDWLDCTDCSDPTARIMGNTEFVFTVNDANGCPISAVIKIFSFVTDEFYVPNVFTPDNSGINDRFTIYGKEGVEIFDFAIYDRWGETLYLKDNFLVNDESAGWDGTYNGDYMEPAVFVWRATVKHLDGRLETVSGDVTLVR